jgi:hypothetical protein
LNRPASLAERRRAQLNALRDVMLLDSPVEVAAGSAGISFATGLDFIV